MTIGDAIGHYQITALLGAGGMGEVYQATDSKLGRSVAIKVLPDAFLRDTGRVARLEREARLLASLNHPHIAILHGLEEANGRSFLVMELVEGPTLSDVIEQRGSGLPLMEVLTIASQIVDALSAAHDKNVIHRDLKPSNIKVGLDGRVKLLDFGLATAPVEDTPSTLSHSPTLTAMATAAGVLMGTAAYMSPEQARGVVVDRRSDVFSFGCVLYEMVTGRRAFGGDAVTEVLARVIEREPDWTQLPAQTPPPLERLLRRSLVKDRVHRLQHIADARLDLDDARTETAIAHSDARSAGGTRWNRLGWIAASILLVALAATIAFQYSRGPAVAPEMRVWLNTPASLDQFSFAVSPDGRAVAFVASPDGQQRLWLQRLDQSAPRPLSGTEAAVYPFWSPDSRSIAFFAGSQLKRIDVDDGVARSLTRAAPGNGGSWGADGQIVFAPTPGSGLFQLAASASGGAVSPVTRVEGTRGFGHRFPQILPGGRVLFYVFGRGEERGIYLASRDAPDDARRITAADGAGLFVEPGWLLFPQQGTLLARRFDPSTGELAGDPIVVAENVPTNGASARAFAASSTGIIAFAAGGTPSRLVWFDRSGRQTGSITTPEGAEFLDPAISPDGKRVAVSRITRNNADIWVFDEAGASRLTLDSANERYPIWSADGSQLLFQSDRNGTFDLYVSSSTVPGRERAVAVSSERKFPSDWSPAGDVLYFQVRQRDALSAGIDLWQRRLDSDASAKSWLASDATELWAQFSPRGDLVAYYSDESGSSQEVYVRRFTQPEERWLISTAGGVYPRWARDGRELYYIDPEGRLMATPIQIKNRDLVPGTPRELFRPGGGYNKVGQRHQYDVHQDGRFLFNVETGARTSSSISLLLNWNPQR